MQWQESQHYPGMINVLFPAAQALALQAACQEYIELAEKQRLQPDELDEGIVERICERDISSGMPFALTPEELDTVQARLGGYVARTAEMSDQLHLFRRPEAARFQNMQRQQMGKYAIQAFDGVGQVLLEQGHESSQMVDSALRQIFMTNGE